MPTSLASCIGNIYEPGFTPASSGEDPTRPVLGTFEDPENYDPDAVTYSLDFTKFYNSMYAGSVV